MSDDTKRPEASARVLVLHDEAIARKELGSLLTREGFDVTLAEDTRQALGRVREQAPDVLVADLRMSKGDGAGLLRRVRELRPEIVVIFVTGRADVESAVRAMKEGAEHYLIQPLQIEELVLVVRRALERKHLREEADGLRARLGDPLGPHHIVASSPAMQEVLKTIEQVAPTKASVLISGESGTGKERVAQALHERSGRARAPYVPVHCSAFADTTLESELFGHEPGAVAWATGSSQGRCEQADGGTLFLDEVGQLSPGLQVKLLRFLQERTFERVGGHETLHADVRVVSATQRDLPSEVAAGRFRQDLYYRLNVVHIEVPPLRARPSDLLLLATLFVRRFARENGKPVEGVSAEAAARLATYGWPGNVRELENVIERAVVLCEGSTLLGKHLPPGVGAVPPGGVSVPGSTLSDIERHAIVSTLEACGWRTSQAAQMLDISVRKIQYKLHEYGITMQRTTSSKPTEPD